MLLDYDDEELKPNDQPAIVQDPDEDYNLSEGRNSSRSFNKDRKTKLLMDSNWLIAPPLNDSFSSADDSSKVMDKMLLDDDNEEPAVKEFNVDEPIISEK